MKGEQERERQSESESERASEREINILVLYRSIHLLLRNSNLGILIYPQAKQEGFPFYICMYISIYLYIHIIYIATPRHAARAHDPFLPPPLVRHDTSRCRHPPHSQSKQPKAQSRHPPPMPHCVTPNQRRPTSRTKKETALAPTNFPRTRARNGANSRDARGFRTKRRSP
jgi:hypothetical protein